MRAIAGLTLLALCATVHAAGPAPKSGERTDEVVRGTFRVLIPVQGTVVTEDVFRLKSTIEGRIENVAAASRTWVKGGQPLGFLVNTELAAMMDAKGTTSRETLEERWQKIYQPMPIRCPGECYVLKVFAKPKEWVRSDTALIEAASRLRLIGRVRPGDSPWIKDGQILKYWDRKNPKRKIEGRVERFVLDVQGQKVDPGGTFSVLLDSRHYLDVGTEWEGLILALVKPDVLSVPTASLLFHEGEVFLPVRVSTGITTYDVTEISAGAAEKQKILILDPSRPPPARHLPPLGAPSQNTRNSVITEEDLKNYSRREPPSTTLSVPANSGKEEDFPSDIK